MKKFGEDFSTPVSCPATKILFEVREDAEKLSENKGDIFHSLVGKLLSIMEKFQIIFIDSCGFLNEWITKKRCR